MDSPANGKPALASQLERSSSGKTPRSPGGSGTPEEQDNVSNAAGLNDHSDGDDDVDDFDFNFNLEQQRGSDSPGQSRQVFRSEEYRQLFHLPPEEVLIQDFNCALQKKILLQGHMYLFEHYVCFYSNIFGYEKKKVIILKDVTCVRKARTAGLFPNAIEIVAWGKKNFFASFLSRDEAYRLVVEGWARHSRYARLVPESQGNLSPALLMANRVEATRDQLDSSFSESSFGSRDIIEVPAENIGEANDLEASEVLQLTDPNVAMENKSIDITEGFASITKGSASIEISLWDVEDEDAPEVPDHYKTVLQLELPVDVKDFFQLLFSNESAKFCETFHKKCGDEDFQCTEWAKHRHFGHVRDVSFRHPIKFHFGPKTTYCQEVQRYHVYRNSYLIIETSQQMNDIPYGDYFRVEGRWDVVMLLGRETPHCSVRISVDVSFSKKTMWKGKIEQGTFDECKEVFSTWIAEAQRTLQERGAIDEKSGKAADTSQLSSTYVHSGSTKAISYPSSLKRKLDAGYDRIQNQNRTSKNSRTAPLARPVTEDELKQSEKPLKTVSSDPVKVSQHLQQGCTVTTFTSFGQMKLAIAICVAVVILLIQTGAIIALARSSRVQYIPFSLSRGEEHYGSHVLHSGRQDTIAWLEQRAQFLKEEITIAEARLENMQYNLNLLKVNVKLLEEMPKNSASRA